MVKYGKTEMKKVIVFASLIFIGIIGIFVWWENGRKPADLNDKAEKVFVIERGNDVRSIASNLKEEGFIKDPIVFFMYVKLNHLDKNIQAGDYKLSPSMSLREIVDNLLHGTLDIWVTVPEGLRSEEVALILEKDFKNYNKSWVKELSKHNGYLFPDTYLIPKDASVEIVISLMEKNFYKKVKEIGLNENTENLSKIVTIASLIEREVRNDDEKPLVASVIYNRLNSGMPLQIDATVQYALSYQNDGKTWWKKNLTSGDLNIESIYNTYKVLGIPPAPISNPGLESLKAAVSPQESDYYYYLSDSKGNTHFSRTLAEHNKNIVNYLNSR